MRMLTKNDVYLILNTSLNRSSGMAIDSYRKSKLIKNIEYLLTILLAQGKILPNVKMPFIGLDNADVNLFDICNIVLLILIS